MIRIGANPIGWSNDDLRELGGETPLETCLKEAKEAGFEGMELGHKFPREPKALEAVLGQRGPRAAAVEDVAAAQPRALGEVPQHPLGRQVRPLDLAAAVHDDDAAGEELEDGPVRDGRPEAELSGAWKGVFGQLRVRMRTFDFRLT